MIDVFHIVAALSLVVGAGFSLLAALGLVRFPDLYTRIHAASKAGVVGAGFILIALALIAFDFSIILRALVAIAFLLLTSPVSAHLLARATYLTRGKPAEITKTNEMKD